MIHTQYIKNIADQTGKSYRELESMWRIAQNTYDKMQMMEPAKYRNLKEKNAESQEIKNIFEKTILKLNVKPTDDVVQEEELQQEEISPDVVSDEEQDFSNDIENQLSEEQPNVEETEEVATEENPEEPKEDLDLDAEINKELGDENQENQEPEDSKKDEVDKILFSESQPVEERSPKKR
jgi:hypothetical protein